MKTIFKNANSNVITEKKKGDIQQFTRKIVGDLTKEIKQGCQPEKVSVGLFGKV